LRIVQTQVKEADSRSPDHQAWCLRTFDPARPLPISRQTARDANVSDFVNQGEVHPLVRTKYLPPIL
jgi:hypothetical protein